MFAAVNSATALRHAIEHAARPRERAWREQIARLESKPPTCASKRSARPSAARRRSAAAARAEAMDATRASSARRANRSSPARASSTSGARRELRTREHELAGRRGAPAARSKSSTPPARSTATRARIVLARVAKRHVGHMGAVADYLEVEPAYERAVEACLGDLLQHVVVPTHEQAAPGLRSSASGTPGACGFVVAGRASACQRAAEAFRRPTRACRSIVRRARHRPGRRRDPRRARRCVDRRIVRGALERGAR